MLKLKLQHYINHIAFVIDTSGSVHHIISDIEKVFDQQIAHLKTRSQELDQETRVSIYAFNNNTECLVFDMDVMRIPSLNRQLASGGMTALLDATSLAIKDMESLPQIYGDHAFLVYTLTDGEENASSITTTQFARRVNGLPDNWTLACMVPDANGIHEAKKFGFPKDNLAVWDTTKEGIVELGNKTKTAMDTYMANRAKGIRSTRTMYSTDLSNVSTKQVQTHLNELDPSLYTILRTNKKDEVIKPFIESWKIPYRIGGAYYELMKTEEIQANKSICIQNRNNGKVYSGTYARSLLKLPNESARVKPGDHGDWRIFVQSTSFNRKLPPQTYVLVMI